MRNKKQLLVFILVILIISACVPKPGEHSTVQEPIKLKVGIFAYSSYLPLYIAQAEGYYAEQDLEVELVPFSSMTDAIVSLSTGQTDISGGPVDVASLAAIGQGTGLKIVADKGYVDPNADCVYGSWMSPDSVLASGELEDVANLKGKTVAFSKASFFEYAMDQLLAPAGLTTKDLNVVEIPAPSRLDALKSGSVTVAHVGEPWITRVLAADAGGIWKSFEETQPNAQFAVIWFGQTITQDNPEAGNRFMVAYLQAVQQYNQGKTDRNVALMAEFTKASEEEVRNTCWQTFQKDGSVNTDFILDFQQWAIEKEYLDKALEVSDFWDGSYLEYARKNLP